MIYAYVGLPGSGKSYSVVANQILPALKEGRTVVTNVPLYQERIREHVTTGDIREFPIDLIAQDPDRLEEHVPAGCVLIIDELWKLFPAGQKVNHVPQAFKTLLAEHRHMVDEGGRSTQIVFVTQDLAQIGAFARQLVEQTYLHKKLGHLGMSGSYSCTVYRAAQTGQNPPQNAEIRSMHGRYEERVYRLYKSHTMSKASSDGANESSVDRRAVIWKRPIFAVIVVATVGLAIMAPGVFRKFFHTEQPSAAVSGANSGDRVADVETRGHASKGSPVAARAPRWRVVMLLVSSSPELSFAELQDAAGGRVRVGADRCRRDDFGTWRCHYQGGDWELVGRERPPVEDTRPIRTWEPPQSIAEGSVGPSVQAIARDREGSSENGIKKPR